MERNQLFKLISSIFVAVIFIASYAAFGNSGSNNVSPQVTTTKIPSTVYAVGFTNGTITGYGPVMSVLLNCNSTKALNATITNVSVYLNKLQVNNSINNFFSPNQTTFTIYTNKLNSYQIYNYINLRLNMTALQKCATYRGQTQISLPLAINMSVNNQKFSIPIPQSRRNSSMVIKIQGVNQHVPLKIATLLTNNGTIYGNMSLTYLGGS